MSEALPTVQAPLGDLLLRLLLAAGAIIRSRGGVRGLTTAASVWICGAIGAASGFGACSLAVLAPRSRS